MLPENRISFTHLLSAHEHAAVAFYKATVTGFTQKQLIEAMHAVARALEALADQKESS